MINILYLHAGAEMYGADKVLLDLVSGLDKTIFNPIVILPNDGILVKRLEENNIKVTVLNYPILRRKYFNIQGIFNYTINYFITSKKIKSIVKKEKIDIVHVNTFAVLQGIYLKVFTNTKLVWHIHEIIKKPRILNKILSFFASKFADETVVVSEAVKQHLIKEANFKNIKVIYNGVPNNIFNPENDIEYLKKEFNVSQNNLIIGMIGRVNSWKGQEDFLEAITPILRNDKNVIAFMVGGVFKGEEYRMESLNELINNLDIKKQIHLIDFRNDPQNIHNLFDIFVLPSTNPDPLPTVVLESMASGKSIVGYNHGGICEMVNNNSNGILVEVGNKEALGNAIINLLYDEKKRNQFGMNSLKRQKEMFSLNAYINNFSNLYQSIFCK